MSTQTNGSLNNNLVPLHQGTVFEDIQAFLSKCRKKSESTANAYEKGLVMFFDWITQGKNSLSQLAPSDLQIKNSTLIRYQDYLIENTDYSNSSINKYMSSLYSFYQFLEINHYDVKAEHMRVDMLYIDKNKNKHGEMNDLEAKVIREYVRTQKKGVEKAVLIRMAYTTSFRKSELLNLEWNDIKKHRSQDVYVVRIVAKGKKDNEIAISEDLYAELLTIKEQKYYQRYNDNKVFHLSKTTIQNMMNDLRNHLQFNDDKGVVFHSFRNVMGGWLEDTGAALTEIQEHMNHSNMETYLEHYKHKTKDFSNSPSVRFEEEIGDDIFDGLGEAELLELIKSQRGGVLAQLKMSAKKLIENKEMEI